MVGRISMVVCVLFAALLAYFGCEFYAMGEEFLAGVCFTSIMFPAYAVWDMSRV
jgi:ABC-type glycerol-3-phosphate transport system permease component